MEPKVDAKRPQSVIRSAVNMALGTFSSRILGFVRDALMLALFDRGLTDAFVVAFRLPNMFRRILGEGALSVSFIPLFVEVRRKSDDEGRTISGGVYTIVVTVASVISSLMLVFMPQIIDFLVDDPRGFGAIPGKVELTIHLARIMCFYLTLVTSFAFLTAIANTLGHFFWPAVGPTLFNLGLIVFMVMPREWFEVDGAGLAWGVLGGGILQLSTVTYILVKEGQWPRLGFRWSPGIQKVFLNTMPGLIGLGVFQLMTIVNTKFAARLGEGAQSFIYAADRILELPQSMVAVSLGAALLPRYSELDASGDRDGFLKETLKSLRALLFLMVPASIGMFILSQPITEVLFMRGEFSAEDAAQTASVLQIYAFLLLTTSMSRVLAPAFYARKNTWLPAAVAGIVLGVHIVVGGLLVDIYGLRGLASATAFASFLNFLLTVVAFQFLIGPLPYRDLFVYLAKQLPGFVIVGVVTYFGYPFLNQSLLQIHLPVSMARSVSLSLVLVGCAYFYLIRPYFKRRRSRGAA